MNNPFSQPKIVYKIHFITNYKSLSLFEEYFPEEILGISTYEIASDTIDARGDDLWCLEAYIANEADMHRMKADLVPYANKHGLLLESAITSEPVEDKDWVTEYQKQLKPLEIGRFFITSTTQGAICPDDKIPIFIEASRAFGTGDHATTSLCIEAMELLEHNSINDILDLGTGSGILSFVGEKIWPNTRILACDIEEVSVEVAKGNLIINNSNVKFYQNTVSDLMIPSGNSKKFDLIISNILAQPLIAMAHEIKTLAHDNTKVILSGFLDYQQEDIKKAYASMGFLVENILLRDKWVALTLAVKVN